MKRKPTIIGGALLLLALTACGPKGLGAVSPTAAPTLAPAVSEITVAPATSAPRDTEQPPIPMELPQAEADPTPEWAGTCRSLLTLLPYVGDIDLDGAPETLDLRAVAGADDYPRWALVLTKNGAETLFQTEIPWDTVYDLWLGDLNEDGAYEIFFHGDLASDDYLIYAFTHDLTPIRFDEDERYDRWGDWDGAVFDGRIAGFEDDHLVIEGVIDMLGTHWGVRNYSLEEGTIGPVSSVWQFEEDDDRFLTVKNTLTAYRAGVRKDPGEAFTLLPGERIYPLASDGCQRLWFKTGDGRTTGVLLLTPDEENLWLIDGKPEAEFFEYLPYSG